MMELVYFLFLPGQPEVSELKKKNEEQSVWSPGFPLPFLGQAQKFLKALFLFVQRI